MNNKYTIGIETITPEKAAALLDNFPRNRKSSSSRVKSYCDIMKRGCWAPFSIIIVDENGNTVDGHHRLDAVVKSGVSVDMVVFRGLESKFVPFIDTGRPRSAGDMLAFVEKVDGLASLRNIASISKAILYFFKKEYNAVIPPDDLANFIVDNMESVQRAHSDYSKIKKIGARVSHAAALWVVRNENKDYQHDIDVFVEKIALGENICSGMPAYAARNAISYSRRNSNGGRMWTEAFYTILRSWSAEISGEKLYRIKTLSARPELIMGLKIKKGEK